MKWLKKLLGMEKQQGAPAPHSVVRVEKKDGVYVLRIRGMLDKGMVDRVQEIATKDIESGAKKLKLLIILDAFRDWKRGDDWGDMTFFQKYESYITHIAVVSDPAWETETRMFLGAGCRAGEVKCFAADQETQARAWLTGRS